MKLKYILFSLHFTVAIIPVSARNKHATQSKFMTYKGLVMAGKMIRGEIPFSNEMPQRNINQ